MAPNSIHPEHIHFGTCSAGGPILYSLNELTAGPDGSASSVTVVHGPPTLLIASNGWFVNVHAGPTMVGNGSKQISCGDVVYGAGALMRFIPGFLVVRTGSTVKWTNYSPQELHTVTILADRMAIPGFTSPQALQQSGNNTSYNGTGYFNSGQMLPGQSYSLTFIKPGVYTYLCLVHDEMNMVGYIEVLPSASNTAAAPMIRLESAQPGGIGSVVAIASQHGLETVDIVLPVTVGSVAIVGVASAMRVITSRKYRRQN